MKEYWVDTQGDAKPMFWHKRTVPLGREAPADFRVGKMLGHQVDEDGVQKFLVQKEGEEEVKPSMLMLMVSSPEMHMLY